VRVRALWWETQQVRDAHIGRKIRAADDRSARAGVGAVVLGAAHAKLQQHLPAPALLDTRGLGGDQCLKIELVEQRGFQNLRHGHRPLHHRQWHVGVNHAPFRDGLQGNTGVIPVLAQPLQEVIFQGLVAHAVALCTQVIDFLIGKMRVLHPIQQPFQPGVDAIARLVRAVIGVTAEEMVELGHFLVQAHAKIQLRHRYLVLIGK